MRECERYEDVRYGRESLREICFCEWIVSGKNMLREGHVEERRYGLRSFSDLRESGGSNVKNIYIFHNYYSFK